MKEFTFPAGKHEPRFDQSSWRVFPLQRGALVVTNCGQELLAQQPELHSILRGYRQDVTNQAGNRTQQRRYFRSGGNSDVYNVGNTPLLVKETSTTHSTWLALDRMDYLYTICNTSMPAYVRVPEHYGAIFSADLRKQYLLMRKANDGVTVQDVKEGSYSEEAKYLVTSQFTKIKGQLDTAIQKFNDAKGLQKELLPDWHEGNVIVDFSTPTANLPFTFWIIDQ